MIRNELQRANKGSDERHREESMDMVKRKLENNGYDKGMFTQPYKHRTKRPPPQFTFRMSYENLSEEFIGRIRYLLKVHKIDARIVNATPKTIEQHASQKQKNVVICTMCKCPMKSAKCTSCYVVYEDLCKICNSSCVGSTGRQVHTRCQEHLRAAMKHDPTSAFGQHYHQQHPQHSPNITFSILQHTARDELRLRISEAYWIRKLQPRINRKVEDMGTGFLA